MNGEVWGDSRIDFVRGIFANHMLDGHITSGVIFDPGIESENIAVDNDNQLAIGKHALDFTS